MGKLMTLGDKLLIMFVRLPLPTVNIYRHSNGICWWKLHIYHRWLFPSAPSISLTYWHYVTSSLPFRQGMAFCDGCFSYYSMTVEINTTIKPSPIFLLRTFHPPLLSSPPLNLKGPTCASSVTHPQSMLYYHDTKYSIIWYNWPRTYMPTWTMYNYWLRLEPCHDCIVGIVISADFIFATVESRSGVATLYHRVD